MTLIEAHMHRHGGQACEITHPNVRWRQYLKTVSGTKYMINRDLSGKVWLSFDEEDKFE